MNEILKLQVGAAYHVDHRGYTHYYFLTPSAHVCVTCHVTASGPGTYCVECQHNSDDIHVIN